jgi:hypothetical protein
MWTVVWKGDEAIGTQVNDFTTWMLTSDYWKAGVTEYGVGAGVAKGVLVVPNPPPQTISDAELQQIIDTNVGKTAGWPTSATNTIISFVTDPKTTVTNQTAQSCVQFGGYHSISQGKSVAYLVNAYCLDSTNTKPDWPNLTVTISHEAAEATVDYDLQHNRVFMPGGFIPMPYPGGGEVGDMCLAVNATLTGNGQTYLVQRIFSDATAAKGNLNPCLTDDGPFFGVGLWSGGSDQSQISITRDQNGNGSATFKLEPFAYDQSVGPIQFYTIGSLIPAGVTFQPDIARRKDMNGNILGTILWGAAGSTATITVKVDSTYQPGLLGGPVPLLFIARNADKSRTNVWWGSVSIQ